MAAAQVKLSAADLAAITAAIPPDVAQGARYLPNQLAALQE